MDPCTFHLRFLTRKSGGTTADERASKKLASPRRHLESGFPVPNSVFGNFAVLHNLKVGPCVPEGSVWFQWTFSGAKLPHTPIMNM